MAARPARIGMITPSSNTCLEPQSYRILEGRTDVTLHFARIPVTRIAADKGSDQQFDQDGMLAAAGLLKDAEVDVIAWNGTSGSWLGTGHDQELVDAIAAEHHVPATTSALAYLDAYDRFSLSKIALVSPYTAEVNQAIAAEYSREGLQVVAERHLGFTVNESFANVPPEDLLKPSLEVGASVDGARPQAIVYMCTNMYGAPIVEQVEWETGLPALDVKCRVW